MDITHTAVREFLNHLLALADPPLVKGVGIRPCRGNEKVDLGLGLVLLYLDEDALAGFIEQDIVPEGAFFDFLSVHGDD